ncbi:MAG TPA: hypothetical protein PK095_25800, partial [Myxococcota bacterium]|nr:hypothetical protein [Myxococcota bacterium]
GDASSLTGAVLTLESEAGTPVAGFDPACRVVGATLECTFEDLAPNTILDVPFAFRFAEPGQHPVRATLSAASPPLDASQTTKSGLVNALASGLDLAVTLEGPARQTVEVGERVSFRFVLANLGTTTETNIIVSGSGFQHLNDRTFTLVDGQGAEACFNADQLCGFFALAPGEFRTIEVSGVFAEPATRTFSASHNKASADLQVRNNTATVEGTAVPATGCPAGQTRFVAFEDDAEADRAVFESVPVYAVRTDFGGGYQSATSWRTVVEQFPVDFDPNLGWISEERGGILRTAAPVEVPAGAGEARFGFWRFQELALQGANAHAVVEYALGAGPHSENDWQDGMPLVVAGASESLAQSGPFAGRYVWAGNSSLDINGGRLWSRTELDLAPLAGEFVSLLLWQRAPLRRRPRPDRLRGRAPAAGCGPGRAHGEPLDPDCRRHEHRHRHRDDARRGRGDAHRGHRRCIPAGAHRGRGCDLRYRDRRRHLSMVRYRDGHERPHARILG